VDIVDKIIAYEQGELDDEATIKLFQSLIDSGDAWRLQGHYGRTARALIEAGRCSFVPDKILEAKRAGNYPPKG
jgi:hypothetical protein